MGNKWPYATRRWRKLRAAHLSCEPCCRFCAEAGRVTVATVVDHVVPVRAARERAFDAINLQSLCAVCHGGAKAKAEKRDRVVGHGVDGLPRGGWE